MAIVNLFTFTYLADIFTQWHLQSEKVVYTILFGEMHNSLRSSQEVKLVMYLKSSDVPT